MEILAASPDDPLEAMMGVPAQIEKMNRNLKILLILRIFKSFF
jgi:hypothetical protein